MAIWQNSIWTAPIAGRVFPKKKQHKLDQGVEGISRQNKFMHVYTFDAKVNKIQWKLLPIDFQSVYQSAQIEKGFAGFSLQAAITLFYYKGWNYKTEDLAFACI